MTVVMDDVVARESRFVLQTYKRNPVTLVRGNGVRVYDADGREYLDLLSGIGVAALGHAHPGLAAAITDQAQTLIHTSNLFYHPLQGQVAERLAQLSGLPRAFFCNSGTEAVEACLKFARRYWFTRGEPRAQFVALDESFHGRTFGSLSVTSDLHYREPFEPLVPTVTFVKTNDPASLLNAVSASTAAIIAEPILGEGGVRPLTPAFAAAIAEACAKTGALFIADEVQCGLGRTGALFAHEHTGIAPDLMTLAKPLAGGLPMGAVLMSDEIAAAIQPGDHGSTFGGGPVVAAVALHVLERLSDRSLLTRVRGDGEWLGDALRALAARGGRVRAVRGIGFMWGIDVMQPAAEVIARARAAGLLLCSAGDYTIRLLPPLIATRDDLVRGLSLLDSSLA